MSFDAVFGRPLRGSWAIGPDAGVLYTHMKLGAEIPA